MVQLTAVRLAPVIRTALESKSSAAARKAASALLILGHVGLDVIRDTANAGSKRPFEVSVPVGGCEVLSNVSDLLDFSMWWFVECEGAWLAICG